MTGGWLSVARQVVASGQHVPPPVPDGVLLDLFTASHLVAVHDALNAANAARFAAMPLPAAASLAFRLTARAAR